MSEGAGLVQNLKSRFRLDSKWRTRLLICGCLFSVSPATTSLQLGPSVNIPFASITLSALSVLAFFMTVAFVVAFVVAVGSLLLTLVPAYRNVCWKLFLNLILVFAVLLAGDVCSEVLRTQAFSQLAVRARPLVAAINSFEKKNGPPPETLSQLVPTYLKQVPQTGMRAYSNYKYEVLEDNKNSPWELSVPCSQGPFNWDVFFYWPTRKYPDEIYGGGVQPIGDWAYVHE